MTLDQWATKWGVPSAAMLDLKRMAGIDAALPVHVPDPHAKPGSESRQSDLVLLEAAKLDVHLWRNNVGALQDERGVPVRYGLLNESKRMNERIKSSDFVGIRRRVITPAMVGSTIGQFVAREMKHEGWRFNPNDKHEAAQLTFINLVLAYGGDASFATGPGTL